MTQDNLHLVGICGDALAGKDTVAEEIAKYCGNHNVDGVSAYVHLFSYADKLKQEVADALGLPINYCYEQPHKEAIRPVLQTWGSARKDPLIGGDPMYWTKCLDPLVEAAARQSRTAEHPVLLIVRDIRYDFEAEYLNDLAKTNHGSSTIMEIRSTDETKTAHSGHSSEDGIRPELVDILFTNNKELGLEHMREFIPGIVKEIMESSSPKEISAVESS